MPAPNTAAEPARQTIEEPPVADPFSSFRLQLILAAVAVVLVTFAFLHPAIFAPRAYVHLRFDPFYSRGIFRFHVALCGAFLVGWLVQPVAEFCLDREQRRLTPKAARTSAAIALILACLLFAVFIIVFGRWQFGGFDHSIIAETGWKEVLGQRPYTDFPTTSPALFNLGLLWAFRLFGVSWDAMLALTAIFTAVTLTWQYLLFRRLGLSLTAALGTSCVIEVATMLGCCFWWYNDTTLVLAAVFFLSAILLTRMPQNQFTQTSFVVSLALLALDKPNIAGITIAGSIALLLVISRQRVRLVLLILSGAALAVLILLAAHISIGAMLAAYRGAARERGAFSSFGFDEFPSGEKFLNVLWYLALSLPLVRCVRPFLADLRARRLPQAAVWLFFPLSLLIAIYGLRGNGELRDVETAVLVCSLGLLAFSLRPEDTLLRRYTVALLCGMAASNLYTGMARDRVYTIGEHMFFEWQDRDHVITSGPLKHMRVSGTFAEMNQEMQHAVSENPGPYFFGPRLDYGYMVFDIPSPRHFPAWWHPGTAFARADMQKIVTGWEQDRFRTLIYFKGTGQQTPFPETTDPNKPAVLGEQSTDYSYYPASLLNDLRTLYIRDDRYPRITVYHRRPGM